MGGGKNQRGYGGKGNHGTEKTLPRPSTPPKQQIVRHYYPPQTFQQMPRGKPPYLSTPIRDLGVKLRMPHSRFVSCTKVQAARRELMLAVDPRCTDETLWPELRYRSIAESYTWEMEGGPSWADQPPLFPLAADISTVSLSSEESAEPQTEDAAKPQTVEARVFSAIEQLVRDLDKNGFVRIDVLNWVLEVVDQMLSDDGFKEEAWVVVLGHICSYSFARGSIGANSPHYTVSLALLKPKAGPAIQQAITWARQTAVNMTTPTKAPTADAVDFERCVGSMAIISFGLYVTYSVGCWIVSWAWPWVVSAFVAPSYLWS